MYRRWSQCWDSTLCCIRKSSLWFPEHWQTWPNHEYNITENPKKTLCPRNSGGSNSANLLQNPRGSSVVDKSYYEQIRQGNELLRVGQLLALDPNTTFKVDQLSWELLKSRLATKGRSGKNGELLILPNWNSGGNFCALVLIEGTRQQNYFRRLAQFCSICDESF